MPAFFFFFFFYLWIAAQPVSRVEQKACDNNARPIVCCEGYARAELMCHMVQSYHTCSVFLFKGAQEQLFKMADKLLINRSRSFLYEPNISPRSLVFAPRLNVHSPLVTSFEAPVIAAVPHEV